MAVAGERPRTSSRFPRSSWRRSKPVIEGWVSSAAKGAASSSSSWPTRWAPPAQRLRLRDRETKDHPSSSLRDAPVNAPVVPSCNQRRLAPPLSPRGAQTRENTERPPPTLTCAAETRRQRTPWQHLLSARARRCPPIWISGQGRTTQRTHAQEATRPLPTGGQERDLRFSCSARR